MITVFQEQTDQKVLVANQILSFELSLHYAAPEQCVNLKALLHYAIFSATCLAMVGNLALQVAEVWC